MSPLPRSTEILLVVFDMAGTTVDDTIDGTPAVAVAMQAAISAHNGLVVTEEAITRIRGREKRDALRTLLVEVTGAPIDDAEVEIAYGLFKIELNKCLSRMNKEIPGTSKVLRGLQDNQIAVAVGSGFPQCVVNALVHKLGWTKTHRVHEDFAEDYESDPLVQFAFSSETLGAGRPNPIMIETAMQAVSGQLGSTPASLVSGHTCVTRGGSRCHDPRQVVKVGDTVVDIEEAKAAGCWSVAVLTGTQSRAQLEAADPDLVIESIAELPEALGLWWDEVSNWATTRSGGTPGYRPISTKAGAMEWVATRDALTAAANEEERAKKRAKTAAETTTFVLPEGRKALVRIAFAGGKRGLAAAKKVLADILDMAVEDHWLELQGGQLSCFIPLHFK